MNWDAQPELWTLKEVVAITRESIKGAYNRLETARYPIAPLPGVRPYRFPKKNVRAFVEEGRVTAQIVTSVHRHFPRKVSA